MGIKTLAYRVKSLWLKLRRGAAVELGRQLVLNPFATISVHPQARLRLADRVNIAKGCFVLAEGGAELTLGEHVSLSRGATVVCHCKVEIGAETMLANGVMVFDHDHDFRAAGGLAARAYRKAPIKIGKNVWIGANAVILRGTEIGDGCVVGAGAVVRGRYPPNSLIIQKRETTVLPIER